MLSFPTELEIDDVDQDPCFLIDLDGNSEQLYEKWFEDGDDDSSELAMRSINWRIPLNEQAQKDKGTLSYNTARGLRGNIEQVVRDYDYKGQYKVLAAYQEYAQRYPKMIMLFSLLRVSGEEGEAALKKHIACRKRNEDNSVVDCLEPALSLQVSFISIFWSGMKHQLEKNRTYSRVSGQDLIRAAVRKIHSVFPYLRYVQVQAYTEGSRALYTRGLGIDLDADSVGDLIHERMYPIRLFKSCITCGNAANFVGKNMMYYCGMTCYSNKNIKK